MKSIDMTVAYKANGFSVDDSVQTFLSNERNTKKIIGLHTEEAQKVGKQNKTALLQLCDGDNCLIVQLPVDGDRNLLFDLFNFLNLAYFTYVGIGNNKTLMNLESDFGLTCNCNDAVEIRPLSWDLANRTEEKNRVVCKFVSFSNSSSTVFSPISFNDPTSAVFEK